VTGAGGHRGTILIVDDDAEVRRAVAEILLDEGYNVAEADDGMVALDYLEHHPPPCVILLDLWMPNLDGETLGMTLRADARWASIPVVVVSALPDGQDRARRFQASAWLQKPLEFSALLGAITAFC
jgi:CheY-like chemotaxis protein